MTHIYDGLIREFHSFEHHGKHDAKAPQRATTTHTPQPATITPDASPATPPENLDMSLFDTLENDAREARDHVIDFFESKLPTALTDVKKLDGNPVIDALLSAAHVPASAFEGVVEVINTLSGLFPKDAAADASTALPEPSSDTQPVTAGPVVGGQA